MIRCMIMQKIFRILLILLGVIDFLFGLGGLVFGLGVDLNNYDLVGLILLLVFFLSFVLIGFVFLHMGFRWKEVTQSLKISMVSNIAFPISAYIVFVTSPNDISAIIHLIVFGGVPVTFLILLIIASPIAYFKYLKL